MCLYRVYIYIYVCMCGDVYMIDGYIQMDFDMLCCGYDSIGYL